MNYILLLLYICSLQLFAQTKVEVYLSKLDNHLSKFEYDIIDSSLDLYQKKFGLQLDIEYKRLERFSDVFAILADSDNLSRLAIYSISITEDRKKMFNFSSPYLSNKYCFLTSEGKQIDLSSEQIYTIGYLEGSTHVPILDKFGKQFKRVSFINDTNRLEALENGKIDLIIAGYVFSWDFKLDVIAFISNQESDLFSVMFPKNSEHYTNFNKVFTYFTHSTHFYSLVNKHFGKRGTEYFNKLDF